MYITPRYCCWAGSLSALQLRIQLSSVSLVHKGVIRLFFFFFFFSEENSLFSLTEKALLGLSATALEITSNGNMVCERVVFQRSVQEPNIIFERLPALPNATKHTIYWLSYPLYKGRVAHCGFAYNSVADVFWKRTTGRWRSVSNFTKTTKWCVPTTKATFNIVFNTMPTHQDNFMKLCCCCEKIRLPYLNPADLHS